MEQAIDDDLLAKFAAVVQGPHGDLLRRLLDILYQQELAEEYFSPEDLAAIEEGFAQIERGECLTLEEYLAGKRL